MWLFIIWFVFWFFIFCLQKSQDTQKQPNWKCCSHIEFWWKLELLGIDKEFITKENSKSCKQVWCSKQWSRNEKLRRVFKMMLAWWRSQSIKYRIWERQSHLCWMLCLLIRLKTDATYPYTSTGNISKRYIDAVP